MPQTASELAAQLTLNKLADISDKLFRQAPLTWEESQAARCAIDAFGAHAAATLELEYDNEEQERLDKDEVIDKLTYIADPF
jgi:hypothetical protein